MGKYLIIVALLFLGCAKPPDDSLRNQARDVAKARKQMEQFDLVYKNEEFQNQKFALFRSYNDVKKGYEDIIAGAKLDDNLQDGKNIYIANNHDREVIRLLNEINNKLEILCGQR